MTTWTYLRVTLFWTEDRGWTTKADRAGGEPRRVERDGFLNDRGAEGWELLQVVEGLQANPSTLTYYFKQPQVSADANTPVP